MRLIPRDKGGNWDLDAVLEQLHYWGVNTDDHLKLTAEEVIKALVKIIHSHNGNDRSHAAEERSDG